MNISHDIVEDYVKLLNKSKSLNKKIDGVTKTVAKTKTQGYKGHLLKSVVVVGLNVVFMKSMFSYFGINQDTSDVIAIIETASNLITVYGIVRKLSN